MGKLYHRNNEIIIRAHAHSLLSLWLISFATALAFGLSRHKVAHAAGKENDLAML